MITKMKKYTFLVFHKEYDEFLTMLREAGVVHISEKAEGVADSEEMQALLVKQKELQHILDQGAPDQMIHERQEVLKKIADTKREAAEVALWGNFDKSKLASLEAAGYAITFWACQKAKFHEEYGVAVAEKSGKIYFAAVNAEDEIADCERIILSKSAADLENDINALNGLLAAADARIDAWKLGPKAEVENELEAIKQQIDWQKVVLATDKAADNKLCLLEGYCPADKANALNEQLEAKHVYYQAVDPILGDNTPTQLKNNKFAKLFEVFTGMYGWPTYGEFDPTPVLAPFYLLFFSLCMGDAGYGFILILFGILLSLKAVKISMFDGLGPIITVLGAGTAVVGFFLGTFFGVPLASLDWYPEALKSIIIQGQVMGYDAQMVLAVGIGIFHICLAMIIKALCYTKRFGFKETISTWGWTLLIVGGLVAFIICMVCNFPALVTKIVLITIASISALGIYIFNKPGRNPLINIGAGLWDTYNMATGILGDVLSYVRLYALGLAGGMLGGAFNDLGGMLLGDNPTWQWVPFALILFFGHVLNILMSALGAFVHPLRLTFVEYFKNAGYEGKGQLYKPFKK